MANSSVTAITTSKLREMRISNNDEKSEGSINGKSVEIDLNSTINYDRSVAPSAESSLFTFDNVIGHLEDMLIDENFHSLQNSFLEKYWEEFDEQEENKHSYMTIFSEYTNKIEEFIVSYLKERITDFDMDLFASELEERRNTLEGEIFEVLLTLSDFKAFKEIFLDYRAMKEGHGIDLAEALCVSSVPH